MPTDKGYTSPRPVGGADRLHLVGLKIASFQVKTTAEATLFVLSCFLYCIKSWLTMRLFVYINSWFQGIIRLPHECSSLPPQMSPLASDIRGGRGNRRKSRGRHVQ